MTPKRRSWRFWVGALLVLALAGAGTAHLLLRAPQATAAPAPLAPVLRQPLAVTVEASGTAQAPQVIEVKSRAGGTVLGTYAETGQRVMKGQLLAHIDPRDVQNALAQAQANEASARVQAAIDDSALTRARTMLRDSVITEEEYETALLNAATARSALVKAETNLQLARLDMGDVSIEAPLTGTILEKDVQTGQVIASASQNISGGTTLYRMADLSTMQIDANVDEVDIGRVRAGQVARVTVDAYPDRTFTGTVRKIEPQAIVDQNVTLFPVLIDLDNHEGLIRPGMNADVVIQVEHLEDAVVVPNDAVVNPSDAVAVGQALGIDSAAVTAQLGPAGGARGGAARGRRGALPDAPDAPGGVSPRGAARRGPARSAAPGPRGAALAGNGTAAAAAAPVVTGAHPAVLFVQTPEGPQARSVLLGMNDLDNSQVIRGVQPGEKVFVASVVRMLQQQQNRQDRFRQRVSRGVMGG